MRSPLAFTFVLCALVAPSLQGPSAVPNCYTCPPVDLAVRTLISTSTSGGQITCQYQTTPNNFFCKYDTGTGALRQDHDNGFCPTTAIASTCARRKRSALPRSPHPPQPGARSVPPVMQTRAYLGKKRHDRRNEKA